MNLTALDTDTDAVIFPFDEGKTRGQCRDVDCRAEMVAVHEHRVSAAEGEPAIVARRAHWRHKVAPEGGRRCSGDRAHKTPWHDHWQLRCTDAERIEARVLRGRQLRVADVMTHFGWAVEFQHSVMKPATAKARETHYRGLLLWVVNVTPSTSIHGSVDIYQEHLRWTDIREWVLEAKTLVAVDDGFRIYLLPPGGLRRYVNASELTVPLAHVRSYGHDEFAREWLNGQTLPLPVQPNTEWAQLAAEKATRSRDRRASDARLIANSDRRAQYDPNADVCSYAGNRGRLVYPDSTPVRHVQIGTWVGTVPMCSRTGCVSAAGTSGWCWSHTPASPAVTDIQFSPLGLTA